MRPCSQIVPLPGAVAAANARQRVPRLAVREVCCPGFVGKPLQPGFIDISARCSDGGDVTELGIAERAAAVLRDELATGALANIDHAVRMWSVREPGVYHVEAARRVLSDIESFVE